MWVLLGGIIGGWVSTQVSVPVAQTLALSGSFSLFAWCWVLERRISAMQVPSTAGAVAQHIASLEERVESLERTIALLGSPAPWGAR
jgi:2-iminoacetate synthase ThiH